MRGVRFELYRYQLLPRDRYFQTDLYGAHTVEAVIARKNEIFSSALGSIERFKSNRSELATELLSEKDGFYLYRLAADRSITRETEDFKKETLDNWPSFLVAVWNQADRQLVAVQKRTAAFQHSESVIKIVADSLAPYLAHAQLTAVWEPLFETAVFWEIVERYKARIQEVDFEIVTPNMANLSKELPENLKELAKRTNSVKNRIGLQAAPSSYLALDDKDASINALVDYASKGGGNISLKISGLKAKIHTANTVKEVEIDEVSVDGPVERLVATLMDSLSSV